MIVMLLNHFTGLTDLTLGYFGINAVVLGFQVAKLTISNIFVLMMGLTIPVNFFSMTHDALAKTHMQPAYNCLFSQVPLFVFFAATYCLFSQTEWAFQNPALACLVVIPAYSLMCSRQIVCNVTEMECESVPKSFFWFLLFPLNRRAI